MYFPRSLNFTICLIELLHISLVPSHAFKGQDVYGQEFTRNRHRVRLDGNCTLVGHRIYKNPHCFRMVYTFDSFVNQQLDLVRFHASRLLPLRRRFGLAFLVPRLEIIDSYQITQFLLERERFVLDFFEVAIIFRLNYCAGKEQRFPRLSF